MTRVADTYVLAIDGGGTRCRIALSDGVDTRRVEVGAANVSTDFQAALAEIQRGLKELADACDLSDAELACISAYLGLAGITGEQIAGRLMAALPFRHVRIADDRAAALRGALGPQDGFIAHCGTGSFLAGQLGGDTRFAGGWGPVLGDQASAQWVGRKALSLTLDCVDDVTERSTLADQLLARLGGAAGIVQAAGCMSPTEFGALAPMVTHAAGQGDPLALSILGDGATYLAGRMVKMGWAKGLPICLTGGIGPYYAEYLPQDMRAALNRPKGDPLSGAIALAHAFHEEIEDEHC